MKAVILTMTSGEGHNNMARVISNELQGMGVESETIDIFKGDSFEYKFNSWGFLFICSYFPKTYDYFWKKLKFRDSAKRYTGIAQKEVEKVANAVAQKVEKSNCDFFVCVHPYTAILCDLWKRQGKFPNKKSFAILPDILPHPLWESAIKCDYILTPTHHSFEQLQWKGFEASQILECGFPVAKKFVCTTNKQEMRQKLNLQEKFTVLVVSGGNGIGKNWKVAKLLSKQNIQILCVNGKNKKAFQKTQKLTKKPHNANIVNFGFVNNLDELLNASDVVVTRGGGGTIFEAMSAKVAIVIREKMIINERENAEILQDAGVAIKLNKLSELPMILENLQQQPEKVCAMQEACQQFTNGLCVTNVCQQILSSL